MAESRTTLRAQIDAFVDAAEALSSWRTLEISYEPRFIVEAMGATSESEYIAFKKDVRKALLENALLEARRVVELREKLKTKEP
jgi:hypothetical protein